MAPQLRFHELNGAQHPVLTLRLTHKNRFGILSPQKSNFLSLSLLVGICFIKHKAYYTCMITSILTCLFIPLGTLLGFLL